MNEKWTLQIDPNFSYSINTQIKEQLKWLIGIGTIRPGELLPPAGQLAEQLHVNRNTVNLVYTQLRDEGIVTMKKGRGTQVMSGPAVEQLQQKRKPMYDLLAKTIGEAKKCRLDPVELMTAGFAYVQMFREIQIPKVRILFVECRGHDHQFYKKQIEQETNAKVTSFFLEDLQSETINGSAPAILWEEAVNDADLIVTTLNHAEEVEQLMPNSDKRLLTIGATADLNTLMAIAQLEQGSRVAFVCLGKQGGTWMAERVKDAGIQHIESMPIGLNEQDVFLQKIEHAEHIYASSAVYDELKTIAPEKTSLYPLVLERTSIRLLKKYGSV